jgi:hypothetical protein
MPSIPSPTNDIPLFSTPINSPPIIAPIIVPFPPEVDAPPIKHAAIASSSKDVPAFGVAAFNLAANTNPDKAANTPIFTNTQNTNFFVFIPDKKEI